MVDDEPLVRRYVGTVLAGSGFQVVSCGHPNEALALSLDDLSVVVCDILLPGMLGPDLVARLLARAPHLRVLFISGYTDGHSDHETRLRWPLLYKPFSPDELRAAVDSILHPSDSRQE